MLPVFLSWSGNSKSVAAALNDWLPQVLHAIRPWYSDEDIAKGARSIVAVESALASTTFGIICVTQANHQSPWLNYEAGFLARELTQSRVTPFLIDLAPANLRGPLANLQATQASKPDVRKLILGLNESLDDDNRLPQARIEKSFERWWPDLEQSLETLRAELNTKVQTPRPMERKLDDLFIATKQIQRDIERVVKRIDGDPASSALPVAFTDAAEAEEPRPADGISLRDRSNFPSLATQLSSAEEFWVVGKSLAGLLVESFTELAEFVQNGNKLRLAFIDPRDEELTRVAARSLYGIGSAEELAGDIRVVMDRCLRLLESAAAADCVEVRLLELVPSFSMTRFVRSPSGSVIVPELYPFRVTSPRRPHFVIHDDDPWYGFFVDQIETVWESALSVTPDLMRELSDDD